MVPALEIAVAGVGEQTATCGNYAGGIAGYLFGDLMFNIAEGFVALRGEDLLWSLSCLGGDQFVCIVKWYVKLAGQFFSYGSFSAVGVAAEENGFCQFCGHFLRILLWV